MPSHAPDELPTYSRLSPVTIDEATPAVHCITGEFADPTLTAEFQSRAFRRAFWIHAVVLGLFAISDTMLALAAPSFTQILYVAMDLLWVPRCASRCI